MPNRVTFYIDGFNFYNGLKDSIRNNAYWKKYYWIDFVALANQFLDASHELVCVKYFTADPLDSGKQQRQAALFKANKILNGDKLKIIKGKYYRKDVTCNAHCRQVFQIPEEKRTDVNISVEMMEDCALNKTDILILVSADSDLVPPIEFIKRNFQDKKIKVYFPPNRTSFDLRNTVSNKVVYLLNNKMKFEKSVMPNIVTDGTLTANIPPSWIYTAPPAI